MSEEIDAYVSAYNEGVETTQKQILEWLKEIKHTDVNAYDDCCMPVGSWARYGDIEKIIERLENEKRN